MYINVLVQQFTQCLKGFKRVMDPNDFSNIEGNEQDVDQAAKLAVEGKGGSKLKAFWSEVAVCARMAKATIAGQYPMKAREKALLISSLAYVVLPLDAVPDVIPVLGYTDDLVVLGAVVAGLGWEILEFKKWESGNKGDGGDDGEPVPLAA